MKELKKYFNTKLDAIKDQFTEKNEKLAKRTNIDPQLKLHNRSNKVQYEFNNFTVAQLHGGWKTMDEYVSDSLVSDSEYERKIKAAEVRALKKQRISTNTD